MHLEDLGFDSWFKSQADLSKLDNWQLARVTAVNKDSFLIGGEKGEMLAELTGKFLFGIEAATDYPTVGDWVYAQYLDDDSFAIIHELVQRRSLLKRKSAGQKVEFQLVAANIDLAFVLQSLDADFNIRRLERYFVMIKQGGCQPVVLLSKSDLSTSADTAQKIDEIKAGFPDTEVIAFSNKDGAGVNRVEALLTKGVTACFLGSSGVGKTTLLNNLLGDGDFKTQNVRAKDGKGKHTTTRRQLTILSNGALIVDTPGMRELANLAVATGLQGTFAEIAELALHCRFNDCSHTRELGCAVQGALEEGRISQGRYENYLKMQRETAFYEMSYEEKRRRDKAFGKMYKAIMKDNVKKPKS